MWSFYNCSRSDVGIIHLTPKIEILLLIISTPLQHCAIQNPVYIELDTVNRHPLHLLQSAAILVGFNCKTEGVFIATLLVEITFFVFCFLTLHLKLICGAFIKNSIVCRISFFCPTFSSPPSLSSPFSFLSHSCHKKKRIFVSIIQPVFILFFILCRKEAVCTLNTAFNDIFSSFVQGNIDALEHIYEEATQHSETEFELLFQHTSHLPPPAAWMRCVDSSDSSSDNSSSDQSCLPLRLIFITFHTCFESVVSSVVA